MSPNLTDAADKPDCDGDAIIILDAEESDVKSPATPSSDEKLPSSDGTESAVEIENTSSSAATESLAATATSASAATTGTSNNLPKDEPHLEKKRAPSPPRWRFVNDAKSTAGYNSLSAGRFVQGKSSDELGAKYTAPDISLYNNKVEKEDPGKLLLREWKRKKDVPPPDETFGGLPNIAIKEKEREKIFREFDASYDLGPKKGRETKWCDSEVDDSYKVGPDEPSKPSEREVGKLPPLPPVPPEEEDFNGNLLKNKPSDPCDESDVISDGSDVIAQLALVDKGNTVCSETFRSDFLNEVCDDSPVPSDRKLKRRKKCILLILLLLLLLVIVGAVLGKKSKPTEVSTAASARGVLLPIEDSTDAPSTFPSSTPTILYSSNPSQEPSSMPSSSPSAMPSSLPSSQPSAFPSDVPSLMPSAEPSIIPTISPTLSPSNQPTKRPTNEPTDQPTSSPTSDPTSDPTVSPTKDPTASPSKQPTTDPTLSPSENPTPAPSLTPTSSPTTRPPTQSPVVFMGGCPQSFDSLAPYDVGEKVESRGLIYECTSNECGSFGFEPGSTSSSLWTHAWKVVGECSGTMSPTSKPTRSPTSKPTGSPTSKPTKSPTRAPTKRPSLRPTTTSPTNKIDDNIDVGRPHAKPTCDATNSTTNEDFNLCLAIDMSGSVCNNGLGGECRGCLPALFCADFMLSLDECCYNFLDVVTFSKAMVSSLGDDFDVVDQSSFSVVRFSTDAKLVSGLSTTDDTLKVLDKLNYAGGLTNHAEGIRLCQETFSESEDPTRKNFIMLITDGEPTVPESDPAGAAEDAASEVKGEGTFIIPVFISRVHEHEILDFMRRLSSDNQVFEVGDFESLNSLQDELVDQVSCQS